MMKTSLSLQESPSVKDGHSKDSTSSSSTGGKEGQDGAER